MGALAMAAGLLLLCQITSGHPFRSSLPIQSSSLQQLGGRAYAMSFGSLREKVTTAAFVRVTEDGRALWPAPVMEQVKTGQGGEFGISPKQLWLSSFDGSDPRSNGKTYRITYAVRLGTGSLTAAWVLTAVGLFLLIVPPVRSRIKLSGDTGSVHYWKKPGYEWGLDLMRCLAVMQVLLVHIPITPAATPVLTDILETIRRGGWVGVDLFFVMSGYLVSGLLIGEYQRTQSVSVGRFLIRRGLKIYPAHWFMILVTVVVASYTGQPQLKIDNIIGEVFYLQNLLSGDQFGSGGAWVHTWSLAVEEHFYLLIAFAFAIGINGGSGANGKGLKFIPWMTISICGMCLVIRLLRLAFVTDANSYLENYYMSYTRMDALMAGVFVRYWRFTNEERFFALCRRLRWWCLLFSLALLSAPYLYGQSRLMLAYGLTTNYLGSASFLIAIVGWQSNPLPTTLRPLTFIGRYSYSIYLWHIPLNYWLYTAIEPQPHSAMSWAAWSMVYLAMNIGIGLLASFVVETPVLRLREAIFRRSRGA